jgi:hypothetical protein
MRLAAAAGLALLWADASHAAAGWTDAGPVESLSPTGLGRFEFTLDIGENPSGCKSATGFYRDYEGFGSEEMFQALLQALVNGKSVRAYVTGRCNLNGDAEVSAISVYR